MSREQIFDELRDTLEQAKQRLNALEPGAKDIYIFGAGNTAMRYRNFFKTEGVHPTAYLDNDKAKQGNEFDGLKVIAPSDVVDKKNALVLICSQQSALNVEASKQLNELGIKNISVDAYFFPLHANQLLQCANMLDDESVSIYAKVIELRMAPESIITDGKLMKYDKDQYFSLTPFIERLRNEVFVDCGAYVGDTLEQYLHIHEGVFNKIFAFEPVEKKF